MNKIPHISEMLVQTGLFTQTYSHIKRAHNLTEKLYKYEMLSFQTGQIVIRLYYMYTLFKVCTKDFKQLFCLKPKIQKKAWALPFFKIRI